MTLLDKARQNRLKALQGLEARKRNIFAGDPRRPDRPAVFSTCRAA